MSPAECPECNGKRLRPASLAVRVKNFSIAEFTALPMSRALMTVRNWEFARPRDADCRTRAGRDPAAAGVPLGRGVWTI